MCPHVHWQCQSGTGVGWYSEYLASTLVPWQTGLLGQAKMARADGVADLTRCPPDSRTVTVGHSRSAQVTRGEPPRVQCAVHITLTVSQ